MDYLKYFFYKIYFDLKSNIRYKFSITSDIIMMTVVYIFFIFSGTGKSFSKEYGTNSIELLLLGYIMWTISITAVSSLSNSLVGEAYNGTIVNIIKSKFKIEWYLFTELISSQALNLFVIIFLILVSFVFFKVRFIFRLSMLLVMFLCLMGMFGIGLVLAGISLYVKKMSGLIMLIQLLLLFITDTIPTNNMILKFTKYILLTIANDTLRRIVGNMDYSIQMTILTISSIIFLLVGIVVFRIFFNRTKNGNTLLLF